MKTAALPGIIKYIICKAQNHILFAVQKHLDLPRSTPDPFSPYPHFPAKLYSAALGDLEIVEVDWVMSHFAQWQTSPELVVIVSLSKASHSYLPMNGLEFLIEKQY